MDSPNWQGNTSSSECRVLIVEDDADSARTFGWITEREGHQIQIVRNGTEALVVAASYKPHIALVDLGLPGLDGFYVVRELRKADKELLVIVTSGRSSESDIELAREAGCDHYLPKPVDLSELVGILAGWKDAGGCAA